MPNPIATFETSLGTFTAEIFADRLPLTAENFVKLAKSGYFGTLKRNGSRPLTVVCILTGHGLKDPERAIKSIRLGKPLPPSLSVISKAVGLK